MEPAGIRNGRISPLSAIIRQALREIEADPERPGSQERPETMTNGAMSYHISLSRTRVSGITLKEPRHFILYRREDGLVEVARILHDGRELARHLPASYRNSDAGSN